MDPSAGSPESKPTHDQRESPPSDTNKDNEPKKPRLSDSSANEISHTPSAASDEHNEHHTQFEDPETETLIDEASKTPAAQADSVSNAAPEYDVHHAEDGTTRTPTPENGTDSSYRTGLSPSKWRMPTRFSDVMSFKLPAKGKSRVLPSQELPSQETPRPIEAYRKKAVFVVYSKHFNHCDSGYCRHTEAVVKSKESAESWVTSQNSEPKYADAKIVVQRSIAERTLFVGYPEHSRVVVKGSGDTSGHGCRVVKFVIEQSKFHDFVGIFDREWSSAPSDSESGVCCQ